ncbi:hypothetical protein P886_2783 [Alteromonadaceae bacterium 2753L.S.0a.02]|nr:hypothetical protein P886_2783 [Alteromonadaceae bacterium 2753L.S.0a.02]
MININKQTGATLVGQMIGMLVSMLAILTCVSMHKSLMQVTVEAKTNAVFDRQISSALLQLQYDLHNAGIGIDSATANDVVAVSNAAGESLFWRFNDAGTYTCLGVREEAYVDAQTQLAGRRLLELQASANCTASSDLASLTWQATATLAQFRNQTNTLFAFEVVQARCTPYGLGQAENHLQVNIDTVTSAQLAGANVSAIEYQYCLANTHI